MSFYDEYHHQYGGGGRGINIVYVGSQHQRGHGLGSFFTGLFRRALPFLTKGARAVGKEALPAGVNILDDVAESNKSFKAFKNRINESGQNLKRKAVEKIDNIMEGSGYKGLPRKTLRQSRSVRGLRRISSKRRKKRSKTIKRKRVRKRKTKRKQDKTKQKVKKCTSEIEKKKKKKH